MCDYYKIRNLFIHYWEFPLGAQKIDENGTEIKFENEFELKIESFTNQFFVDVIGKITLFFIEMKDRELKKLLENLTIIKTKLEN